MPTEGIVAESNRMWIRNFGSEKVQALLDVIEPVVVSSDYELVDLEYAPEKGGVVLRLFVDTVPPSDETMGVSIEDCTRVSRVVSEVLDQRDPIEGEYRLEVSSPGLFRPLTKAEHFTRVVGSRVRIVAIEKIKGRGVFVGMLRALKDGQLHLEVDSTEVAVPFELVKKANLEPLL